MEKISKILAPTDFSELSRAGARSALELAKAKRFPNGDTAPISHGHRGGLPFILHGDMKGGDGADKTDSSRT